MHVNICDSNSGRTTAGSRECEKLRIYHRHLLSVLVLRGDDSAALPMLRLVIGPVHCPMYTEMEPSVSDHQCVCVCVCEHVVLIEQMRENALLSDLVLVQ